MTKADQAQMFVEFLRAEGYAPEIDDDGDVAFKYEGLAYWIILSEEDDEFFRLLLPDFWPIKSQEERARAEKAAMLATTKVKVAKVYLVRDSVFAAIEMFCSPLETAKPVIKRSLSALLTAAKTFAEEMEP